MSKNWADYFVCVFHQIQKCMKEKSKKVFFSDSRPFASGKHLTFSLTPRKKILSFPYKSHFFQWFREKSFSNFRRFLVSGLHKTTHEKKVFSILNRRRKKTHFTVLFEHVTSWEKSIEIAFDIYTYEGSFSRKKYTQPEKNLQIRHKACEFYF